MPIVSITSSELLPMVVQYSGQWSSDFRKLVGGETLTNDWRLEFDKLNEETIELLIEDWSENGFVSLSRDLARESSIIFIGDVAISFLVVNWFESFFFPLTINESSLSIVVCIEARRFLFFIL